MKGVQEFAADLTCLVAEFADVYEVILGDAWLSGLGAPPSFRAASWLIRHPGYATCVNVSDNAGDLMQHTSCVVNYDQSGLTQLQMKEWHDGTVPCTPCS